MTATGDLPWSCRRFAGFSRGVDDIADAKYLKCGENDRVRSVFGPESATSEALHGTGDTMASLGTPT